MHAAALVRAYFAAHRGTTLLDNVDALVEGQVERCRAQTAARVRWLLTLESPPYTLNDQYFSARYKDACKVGPAAAHLCRR